MDTVQTLGMTPAKHTHTPVRSIRINDELWQEAQRIAATRGETVTDVVTRSLRSYVARNKPLRETSAFQSAVPCDVCGHSRATHLDDLTGCGGFQQFDPPRAGHIDRCRCTGYRTPEEYR
jgi:Arc/MetJ family transcription regulator